MVAAARVVYDGPNKTLNDNFVDKLFTLQDGKRLRLGDVVRWAKLLTGGGGNKLNFNLLGDPALMPTYPDYKVVVDEFDGPPSDELPFMRAGAKVTVKGHILTPDGKPADDFTGTVHPLVYDSKMTITYRIHS